MPVDHICSQLTMRATNILITAATCFITVRGLEESCSIDNPECETNAGEKSKYSGPAEAEAALEKIEVLRRSNLNKALEEVNKFVHSHPESPKGLLLLSKIKRSLYSKLHPKMREIGRREFLNPSIDALFKIFELSKENLSDEQHAETAEFAAASALGLGNKTISTKMLKTILERQNPSIPMETYR